MTEQVRWVMAQYVEAVSMWRMTVTPVVINAAKNVTFVVSGAEKAEQLWDVLERPTTGGVACSNHQAGARTTVVAS